MKSTFLFTLVFALFATVSFAQIQNTYIKTNINHKTFNQKFNYGKANLKNIVPNEPICPDLKAAGIHFRLVQKFTQFRGNVKITGTVKNISSTNFRSSNQGAVMLYEIVPGATPRVVASRSISNLDAGRSISVSYTRHWNISSPAEGEFPPSYRVCVIYDPDIALDSNKLNDDCNSRNNCAERSGVAIAKLFR